VNSFRYRSFLLCVLLVAAATGAVAQNYAFPAATPNTDVLCSLCPGRETLLTIGYPPVLRFVGRWADAEIEHDYQQNFRTARPKLARYVPGKNRLYTLLGSALAVYDADRFFARLSARPQEQMTPATLVPTAGGSGRNVAFFGPPEVFLWWDAFFYAENGGGWITPFEDGQERLWDFDWDDRGNVYLAYSTFGWGIVKDSGDNGGGWMQTVSQTVKVNSITPDHILAVKTSDGRYYAAVSDKTSPSTLQIWDTSNPAVPIKQPEITGRSFYLWAKDSTGSRVAITEYSGGLSIFTTDDFVRTGTPIIRFEAGGGGTFKLVTSDGTNFYAYGASGSGPFISVVSPSGNTYVEKRYPTNGYGVPQGMHYGDGYLAIFGVEIPPVGTWNIRVYKVGPGSLTEIPFEMPVPGSNGTRQQPFWSMYYGANAPQGYARPNYNLIMDATPVKVGSKINLVVSAYGLGDVWEIKAGDSLTARLTGSVETPNPHSAAAAGTGPFYGDRQSFTSSLASGNVANVTWDYGDNTSASSVTNGVVKHQYGGVTSLASLPLVRRATASNAVDLTMSDTVSVTLAAPQVGFQLANTTYLFRQPDASSTAPIVVGDSFFDASDGSVEGHYTDWVLDSASNKKLPSEAFGVGACGVHSLAFNTHYGPYSGTGSAITASSDLPLSISPFVYTVRPYVITVQEPGPATINDPNAVFTAAVRTAGAADLPSGVATPVTYKWEVIDASQTTILNAAGSATLGTIPSFSVPRTTFSTLGLRVRLSTTVAASAVPGTGCSSLASAVAQSSELNGPDPVIVKTGCSTVGSPCSFTVTSAKNPTLAGWSFAWTVNPTVTNSGTTAAVFSPQFTTTTDYSVGVTVTNGIGSKTATLSGQHIDKPLCSSAPDNINNAIGINNNNVPNPGDTVTFIMFPRGWTPSVECDKFAWTFGDGGTSTEMVPSHVYNTAGTYNVSLVLTGALATNTYTTTVTIGTSAPPPPPPPPNNGGCSAPQANSAYVAYTGPLSSCTAVAGACNTGELVQFGLWPDSGYSLSCGTTSILWNFGDGTFGSGLNPTHAYSGSGIFHAQATLSNGGGSFTYAHDVRVGTVANVCSTLTNQNVSIGLTGTGCTETSPSGTCKAQDLIAFRPVGTGYDFSCPATHTYDWDFGDGSSHSTAQSPSHSFAGPGTYNVKLLVSNGTSSATITRTLTLSSSGGVGGGPCGPMEADVNVYVSYFGDGCGPFSGNCSAKTDVAFGVTSRGYVFECAPHTYAWDFGDGTHSTDKAPTHRYTADGTYHVTVHLSNGSAAVDLTSTVKVVGAPPVAPRGGHAVRH